MTFTPEQRKVLQEKFFADPDFAVIRQAVIEEIAKLDGLQGINDTLPAEDVKCQVKGHKAAQELLTKFFVSCGILPSDSPTSQREADFN